MKPIVLFIVLFFIGSLLAFANDLQHTAVLADIGLTFLELMLLAVGAPAGGLGIVLVRAARSGTKAVLKSLDSNPYVDNEKLVRHAITQGDKRAKKLFQTIEAGSS